MDQRVWDHMGVCDLSCGWQSIAGGGVMCEEQRRRTWCVEKL